MEDHPTYSIVVPLFNEAESVRPLVESVRVAMHDLGEWEMILVDDGSTDRTAAIAAELAASDRRVRLVQLARNYGQTPALQAGFDTARGRIVVTMDGDLQNDPADIPRMVAKLEEGFDLVAGYRVDRKDNLLLRKVPSVTANWIIRWITGVSVRDSGCSLKAFRKEILDRMILYSDMHRFIPVVAAATTGARVVELPVNHRPRMYGESKYGLSRIWKVMVDLMVMAMIRSFRERPMALFAQGALASAVAGLAFLAGGILIAGGSPSLAISEALVIPGSALLWLGLSVYLLMLGLIAEVALRGTREQDSAYLPLVHEGDL